ncbi:MAG: LCP family protein [Fimbriimonadales bacterium]|nr:LCP family protein [Fimbriimonadales bacterium]
MSSSASLASRLLRIAGALVHLSLCALALLVGTALGYFAQGPLGTAAVVRVLRSRDPSTAFEDRSEITLLVLGCDEDRSAGGARVLRNQARSDMILVAKVFFKDRKVEGVSIPRDLEVQLPGYRPQKINAYHAIGGKELAKRAVEHVLGVPIDRVLVLDYRAFQDMVDLVGGVRINVEKRMRWRDRAGDLNIDLQPGEQLLSGYQAMGYVRFRHSDSDFLRQGRQRQFLLAFKEAALRDPLKLNALAEKAVEATGGGLTAEEILAMAMFARNLSKEDVRLGAVPVLPGRGTNLRLDVQELPKVLEDHRLLTSSHRRENQP